MIGWEGGSERIRGEEWEGYEGYVVEKGKPGYVGIFVRASGRDSRWIPGPRGASSWTE